VHSITIRGDERANALISNLGLRPREVPTPGRVGERYALRGARYGQVRAFFLDDAIYMESEGLWTRGDSAAELVVVNDAGDGGVDIDVTAGPVATTVNFAIGGDTQRIALAAGQRQRVQLAAGLWKVTTTGRFRPKDYDPGSRDARPLGVRIEFP
jgi:hypothetical protein